ncbi:MAG: hypothetical protein AAF479_17825, partial [Pseudomonadota bacterium]
LCNFCSLIELEPGLARLRAGGPSAAAWRFMAAKASDDCFATEALQVARPGGGRARTVGLRT